MPSPTPAARQPAAEPDLPKHIMEALTARGITDIGEVALRQALENAAPAYTLFRLTPAAARKWKARYRIMLAADYHDCQSVREAYACALLSALPPIVEAQGRQSAGPAGNDADDKLATDP